MIDSDSRGRQHFVLLIILAEILEMFWKWKMTENWSSNGLCRCCHLEGKFPSLNTVHTRKQSKSMYAEVLRETLGIQILPLLNSDELKYSICYLCIRQLEETYTFKQKILKCEDAFMKWYKDKLKDSTQSDGETVQTCVITPDIDDTDLIQSDGETVQTSVIGPLIDETEIISKKNESRNKTNKENTVSSKYNTVYKRNCHICDETFATNKQLVNHISVRHTDQKSTIQKTSQNTSEENKLDKEDKCPICQKILKRHSIKEHMKSHETAEFICHVCGKLFYKQSELFRHSAIHTGVKPYACYICNKKFGRKDSLTKHIRIHNGEKLFKCGICKKAFSDPSSKAVHMRLHSDITPYKCSFCFQNFKYIGSVKRHERIHTGERPYSCDICKKTFNNPSAIKPHLRTHTGEKPYQCHLCSKAFTEKQSLKRHMNLHSGKQPYRCGICEKAISSLSKHMRVIHSNEKPYKCSICEKRFADNGYLKLHFRTHTGERPFGCNECEKRFTQNHVLKNHKCVTGVNRKKKMVE